MKSKTVFYICVVLLIVLAFSVAPVAAKKSGGGKKSGSEGEVGISTSASKPEKPAKEKPEKPGKPEMTGVLKLVEKNPTDWTIVEGGAQGNFNGALFKKKIIFNAQGVAPTTTYALISYNEPDPADPWNYGAGSKVIATGTSNADQKLQIKNVNLKDNLLYYDYTDYPTGDYREGTGAKVWLVPISDLTSSTVGGETAFNTWNPTTYLFETRLIPQT